MPVTQQRLMLGQFYEVIAMIPLRNTAPLRRFGLNVIDSEEVLNRSVFYVLDESGDRHVLNKPRDNQIITTADNMEPLAVLDEIHEADLDKFNTFVEDVQRSYCEDFGHNIYSCLGLNFFSVNVIALSSDFGTAPRA